MRKDRKIYPIPEPPFWGTKIIDSVPMESVARFADKITLFKGQWRNRTGLPKYAETDLAVKNMILPLFNSMMEHYRKTIKFYLRAVYGYFPCNTEGNEVVIYKPDFETEITKFSFPRIGVQKSRCIADLFLPVAVPQYDVIAFFAGTIGDSVSGEANRILNDGNLNNYNTLTGFAVTLTEALAEFLHKMIREELKIHLSDSKETVKILRKAYRGCRYIPGEPAFPAVNERSEILKLLEAERIGIKLNEKWEFFPEYSTTALICHNSLADHFS
jgi:5-methyltetrahydrofolate--homocysteine methyltransferase